ncbi:hypothetical protein WI97_07290 [Burkholderia vietnamiensis]|nr:hypothetical protein WI97_07290 [Burkholderia vietnamiensis]
MLTIVQSGKMRTIEPEHCQHCVIDVMHSRQTTKEFVTRNLYTARLKRVTCAAFDNAAFDGFHIEMVA